MTGEEFLNKVRSIQRITGIRWETVGDVLDADEVKVIITADGEEFSILVGHPKDTSKIDWWREVSIRLVIQKILQQEDIEAVLPADLVEEINFARKVMKGGAYDE
jgi:hypothetical protein|nr:MAG TPA: hypothetical protein [Caudoviricetes sp.]